MYEKLVDVFRGELIESRHFGAIAVVDPEGNLLYSSGDPFEKTYWRSAAKPIQAIPIVADGAAEYYQFTKRELALIVASHSGEDKHISLVKSILDKIGLSADDLKCGLHYPYNKQAKAKLIQSDQELSPLYNNCSGKHAGLLALCRYNNWSIENYFELTHPLQQSLMSYISLMTSIPKDKIVTGEDGCGVVVYGLPIVNMAQAYARLANPGYLPAYLQPAVAKIRDAMIDNPDAVGGTGRFNTDLMAVIGDAIVAKTGAEGVFSLGIIGGPGITIKVSDGNKRAIPPVIMNLLERFIDLTDKQINELSKYINPVVKNHKDNEVGRIKSAFTLNNKENPKGDN
ncbi:MAG: asparaginase [Bacillota bacterium]